MTFYGRDEIASYFERFIGAWQALHAEAVDFEARPGEQVIATVRMGPPTGSATGDIEASVAHLWTLRHGKVARVRVFGMREAARGARCAGGAGPRGRRQRSRRRLRRRLPWRIAGGRRSASTAVRRPSRSRP